MLFPGYNVYFEYFDKLINFVYHFYLFATLYYSYTFKDD